MSIGVIATLVYGVLAIVGGVIGYAQAKSKISLLAGCGCGAALLAFGLVNAQGQAWGLIAATAVTLVLLLAFTMRWFKTRKFMPAGLMLILGVLSLGMMTGQLLKAW